MTTIALLSGMMISATLLLLAIRRAPRGYEDRDGFHYEERGPRNEPRGNVRPSQMSRSTPGVQPRRRRQQSGRVFLPVPFRQPRSLGSVRIARNC